MATKSFKEVQNLSKDELLLKIRESEKGLFESRMKFQTGQLENVASIWKQRKNLARMKMRVTQLEQSGRTEKV